MVLLATEKHLDDIPLCSVCIANYNGENYLEKCIDSILAQEGFPGRIEIIVHDDASSDGSVNHIQSSYPDVCLLTAEENVGFCVSNNRMVSAARGQFLLLLNNDAALHKDALRTLYSASKRHGDGIYGLPQYDAETGVLIDIGSIFDLFLNPVPNIDRSCQDVGMIIGACLWLPKSLWDKIGGFPEWFGSLAEDMYICCVTRLWGHPVKALPQSGFDHWVGGSLGGGKVLKNRKLATTIRRRSLSERNKTYVMFMCYPALMFFLITPFHLFSLCLEGLLLVAMYRNSQIWKEIYWKCIVDVVRARKLLFEHRKIVQTSRKISLLQFLKPFRLIPHKFRMFFRHGLPSIKQ